jgi:hypothetical protein
MSAKWLAVGSVVAGLGGLLAIGWLINVKTANQTYWQWPGILGLIVLGIGFVGLIVGFVLRDETSGPSQVQQGGDNSVNLQAGRDITTRKNSEGDKK